MTFRYELYGLVIDSDVDLHQERAASPDRPADLVVRHASARSAQGPLSGTTVLEHTRDGRTWYEAVRAPDGVIVLRFDAVCDVVMSPDVRHAVVHLVPEADPGFVSVLVTGALLSFVLSWRSDLVLHGSAVSVERQGARSVVAFVGRSGMGKSTMATLLCAAGGDLVTDDVLVLDEHRGGYLARPGATEVRLREAAASLAQGFGGPEARVRRSADDRHVLRPRVPRTSDDLGSLAALVVPFPDRVHDVVHVERISPRDAAVLLLRFPRLSEWRDDRVLTEHFARLARLAESVPVLLARVPWGPPFRADVAEELLSLLLLRDPRVKDAQAVGSRSV